MIQTGVFSYDLTNTFIFDVKLRGELIILLPFEEFFPVNSADDKMRYDRQKHNNQFIQQSGNTFGTVLKDRPDTRTGDCSWSFHYSKFL